MKRVLSMVLAAAMLISLAACAGGDESYDEVLDKKAIIMGYDKSYMPMGFVDDNGTYTGFDIDLAKAICKRIISPSGVQATLNVMPVNGVDGVAGLLNGSIDFLGNSITAKGEGSLDYSDVIFTTKQVIAVSKQEYKSKADLEGKKVAVVTASASAEALAGDSAFNAKVTATEYADAKAAAQAVSSGEADAVVLDEMAVKYLNKNGAALSVLEEDLGVNEYRLVFNADSRALKKEVNKILKELNEDGTMKELTTKWFGE